MSDGNNVPQQAGERESLRRVAFYLPEALDRALEIEAAHRDLTKSQLVADAISEYIPEAVRRYMESIVTPKQ